MKAGKKHSTFNAQHSTLNLGCQFGLHWRFNVEGSMLKVFLHQVEAAN